MEQHTISFIMPSHNNLRHLKNAYKSIEKHAPNCEVILLDDGSTDGTWEWIWELAEAHHHREVKCYRSLDRVGHTILYDKGIELATSEIVGILHADMIIGPNYVENILKHLLPNKVVCATRVEPPLHPVGKEKILMNFGLDFDSLNIGEFEKFCDQKQIEFKDQTTKGMFAPWVLYKKDFQSMGGHDPLFAPFPIEDSDIFERWILSGYELIQSRDAFVYHLTCRGHRWTEQIGKDDEFYKAANSRAIRNYVRKWNSGIKNDEYQHPIVSPKYNIAFVVDKCNSQFLEILELWCDKIYIDDEMQVLTSHYIDQEQKNTLFDLNKRIFDKKYNDPFSGNDIIVEFDCTKITNSSFEIISNLSDIIKQSGSIGTFELDIFKITINALTEYQYKLRTLSDEYYTSKLI